MDGKHWQFWIDVGGTFTDCVARAPSGQLRHHKSLSSGTLPGRIDQVAGTRVTDARRRGDAPDLWRGCRLAVKDQQGSVHRAAVTAFQTVEGTFQLDAALPVRPGQSYWLESDDPAPLVAARMLMGVPFDQPLPPLSMRLGTTRGTNALLTRRGASVALVTTRGLGDILRIGYQNRPRLFELDIRKHECLFQESVELEERLDADGNVLTPLNLEQTQRELARLKAAGIESLAVCLMHAYRNGQHERSVEELALRMGFQQVSLSHRCAPLIKLVSRGDTTVVDAYLTPVIRGYIDRLRQAFRSPDDLDLRLLTSAGSLVLPDEFSGKDSILSGPAGGVVGFSVAAQAAGFERAIGFDMGGTSTDVTRFDGSFSLQYETEKSGVRVVAPMMAIETVAAGGGSVCAYDGTRFTVGPDSAGADPGPACYGRGGPLTITDLNLFLGRIQPTRFPIPLDLEATRCRLEDLARQARQAEPTESDLVELALGLLEIANAKMAQAIQTISVQQGYHPAEYLLVAFGGAAPQHACAIARILGIERILLHPDAGILSAFGIRQAPVVKHRLQAVYSILDAKLNERLRQDFKLLEKAAIADLAAQREPFLSTRIVRKVDVRYRGTEAALTMEIDSVEDIRPEFEATHQARYGYGFPNRDLEILALRVEAIGILQLPQDPSTRVAPKPAIPGDRVRCYFQGRAFQTPVYDRDLLEPGATCAGPGILLEDLSTIVIEPGWQASVLSGGELLLEQLSDDNDGNTDSTHMPPSVDPQVADPIELELFNNAFAAIAEQMGETLRNTSCSVNVKERLDFSCAIFTGQGDLVVNAPHVPVHLGAMATTVKRLLQAYDVEPGSVWLTNDPYQGGSHLPDLTVITPVFLPEHKQPTFFVASRAHHAEIGGMTPGSMPPFSRNLAEEGVLIRPLNIVAKGQFLEQPLRELLSTGPFPSRAVEDNIADIVAQVAANQQGAAALVSRVAQRGESMVVAYMDHLQQAAETRTRRTLRKKGNQTRRFIDHLDDGTIIQVELRFHDGNLEVDFTGSGETSAGNLNANSAIVTAALMYALRCLIEDDVLLNQGVLAPVKLVLPQGLLNPPYHERPDQCPAVAAGNVETSQRLVDVLLGAMDLAAASQGTMNNVLFGDATFGYYETVCGGAGATERAPGADAVHTHMTNTRLTDPEILEQRFPVRLHRFAIRQGSGGGGRHRGGNGVIREIEFLCELELSILSQRRGPYPPYGLAGGEPGAVGENLLRRASGEVETLPSIAHAIVQPGDRLILKTPGGGGYGKP